MTARRRDRLDGVDAARGAALLGMASVHVFPVRDDGGQTHVAHLVAAGRSAALFALLAGVGIALATGGRNPLRGGRRARAAIALVVRGLLVGLVGLLLAELDTGVAVILAYYAVLFLVAVPLLGLGVRWLAALALAVAVAAPFLSSAIRDDLPRASTESPTIGTLLDEPLALLQAVTVTGYYPVLGWTAYLCAGLAVGRLALGSRRAAAALLAVGAVLAVGAAALSALMLGPLGGYDRIEEAGDLRGLPVEEATSRGRFGTVPTTTDWWLAVDAPHSTTPLDLLHTIGTGLVVLGLALLLVPLVKGALAPLAAAGSMPLSMYTLHLVTLHLVDDVDPLRFWAAQAVAALVLATLWRRYVGRGPLEIPVAALSRTITGRGRT